MADARRQLDIVISAKDEASKRIKGVGQSFKNLADDAAIGAGIITGAVALVAKSAVEMGSTFEQSRIAFETMLGSGEKAGKLLKDISDFAVKTPFDFPQVVEGTKQLLAMGSGADEVIGELKMLGDVSAGLGVPMSRLILNFGQVRTQSKLTGRELRDFNVAGVPLIDTLVELGNEGKLSAGAFETVGATSDKTKKKIGDLSFSIKTQTRRLNEMKDAGRDGSAAYKNLSDTIERNKGKLGALGEVTDGYSQKIVYTKEKIAEMVSDGLIKFEDVSLAFEHMTGEGGRFFDLMEKQALTFGGVMSNIRDELIRFGLAVLGFTEEGEIRKGSIFYYLKEGARVLQNKLQEVRPLVQGFVDSIMNNLPVISAIIGAFTGLIIILAAKFVALLAPALLVMGIFAGIGVAVGKLIENYVGEDGLENALERVKNKMMDVKDFIETQLIKVTDWLSDRVKWLSEKVGGKEGLKEKWDRFHETATKVWNFAMKFLIPMWQFMTARVKSLIERIKEMDIDWKALGDYLKVFAVVVGGLVLAFLLGLMAIISAIAWVIEHIVIPAIEWWTGQLTGVINTIKDLIGWLKDAYNWIQKVFKDRKASFKIGKSRNDQHGGFVNAPFGQAVPSMLHGGERVVPRTGVDVNQGSGIGSVSLNFTGPVTMDSDARVQDLADRIVDILGRQNELAAKGLAI